MSIFARLWRNRAIGAVTGGTTFNYSSLGFTGGESFVVGSGTTVVMDIQSVKHADVSISGTVTMPRSGVSYSRLWANSITVNSGGVLDIGSKASPLPSSASFDLILDGAAPTVNGFSSAQRTALGIGTGIIRGLTHKSATGSAPAYPNPDWNTPTGNDGFNNDNQGISRGIRVMDGGTFTAVGSVQTNFRTRLNANWTSGTTITLADPITAKAGEKIWVSPTNYYNASNRTEQLTLAADCNNSTSVTLTAGPTYPRWGQLQYVTDTGISLSPGTWSTLKAYSTMDPTIDQRAYVVIPKRNTTIRSATDVETGTTALSSLGFGVHVMSMGITSVTYLDGVWLKDYGQLGLLGRYGVHWHQPSYAADGSTLGTYATDKAVVRNCVFDTGHNRAITLHACRGVLSEFNSAYRSKGHTFFEEEGSEMLNTSQHNWAFRATTPDAGMSLKVHDNTAAFQGGASGHWFSNQNNKHIDNHGVDCDGFGWWNAWGRGLSAIQVDRNHGCLGFSANVPIAPSYGIMDTWDGNTGMSCQVAGGTTDNAPGDNAGNPLSWKLQTTTDGLYQADYGATNQIPTLIQNARLYQNGSGYSNRISIPHYQGWKVVDSVNGLSGATDQGTFDRGLVVKSSLNNLDGASLSYSVAFATYHGTLQFKDLSAYGYAGQDPIQLLGHQRLLGATAVMDGWDLYLNPLECFMSSMSNWKLFNSVPHFRVPPAALMHPAYDTYNTDPQNQSVNYTGSAPVKRPWSITGALQDPNGTLTGTTNSYLTFNQPFFTTGVTSSAQGSTHGLEKQAIVTGTDYYGISSDPDGSVTSFNFRQEAVTYQRVDSSYADISGANYVLGDSTGTNSDFVYFHHTVIPRGQRMRQFNQASSTNYTVGLVWYVWNLHKTVAVDGVEDYFVLGVPWATTVSDIHLEPDNTGYISKTSRANLEATSSGGAYWIDATNHMLWIRVATPGSHYSDAGALCNYGKLHVSP